MTTKRSAVQNTSTRSAAIAGAAKGVNPPKGVKLRACDRPFWAAITGTRIATDWADLDLMHAATLARTLADIEATKAQLVVEGLIITRGRGKAVHPAHGLLEDLTKRSMNLTKMLHLHALPGARVRDEGSRKKLAMEASRMVGRNRQINDDDDGLLARPPLQ